MNYKDLFESFIEDLTETKITSVTQDEKGVVKIVVKGGKKVFPGSKARSTWSRLKGHGVITPRADAGEAFEDVPLGAPLTLDQMKKMEADKAAKSEKRTEQAVRIADTLLNEAKIQKLIFKSAEDAEQAAAHSAERLRRRMAAGEDPRALSSDPNRDLQINPLKQAKMDRLTFLKDAVEKRSTPVKGSSTTRQPIGDRTIRSMSDEISQIETELGITKPTQSAQQAKQDLDTIFKPEGSSPSSSAGRLAFDALFKS